MGEGMNRPLYETGTDRVNEQKVADKISAARPYELCKLPRLHAMDYVALQDNKVKAFIEIKCRNVAKHKYPTTMVGFEKVAEARNIYREFGVKSFLFVQWTDELGYICLNRDCSLELGGRWDRGDPQDVSVYAFFPVDEFKVL
jgi:hypothetical protein